MPPYPIELPPAPAWQAALTLAPAAAVGLGAVLGRAAPAATGWRRARLAASLALAAALASLVALALAGPGQALVLRADAVGSVAALLVTFIGWVIVRYAQPYLAGQPGEAGAIRWLLATLAAVLLVVASNHLLLLALAWSGASLALHRLLTFFGDRQAAVTAAHKKYVLGRVADLALLGACTLLALEFGTLRIDALLARAAAAETLAATTHVAAFLVAVAALIKCAQLPFHGWLIQVMEAPTPVSALLHAGVVNLGGLVLVRLAPLVADAPAAVGALVVVGTGTAVVAALVMSTRISIKVSLAWSTCAQMGFMLVQCGLGLWQMALLHLVAHSLYKAHAFLGAGGVVRRTQVRQLAAPAAGASLPGQLAAAAVALGLTLAAALVAGAGAHAEPALWVMAGVLALALAPMLHAAPATPLGALRGGATAFALAGLYFTLHGLLQNWVAPADALPAAPWWLLVGASFAALFVLQSVLAVHPGGPLAARLYPWFYGGLFLDQIFSRFMFRHWPPPRAARPDPA